MSFRVIVYPSGEILEISVNDGKVYICDELLEYLEEETENKFFRPLKETEEQLKLAYSLHESKLLDDMPCLVVELIVQGCQRLIENRQMTEVIYINLDEMSLWSDEGNLAIDLPSLDNESSIWCSRNLKNLIYQNSNSL